MKKKLITLTLAVLGLSIISVSILQYLGFFKEQQAGLLVESNPISSVFINGQEVGRTPFEVEKESGEINLRIKPDEKEGQILDDYETKVTLASGIKTIIKRNFSETEDQSSGVVVSFEKLGADESYVTVVSIPDNAQVLIDDRVRGYTPIRMKVAAGDHNLVVKADGYNKMTLPIRVFKGFKLTASVKLSKSGEQIVEEILSIEIQKKVMVRIDKNTVGFLRVRSGASTGFPEVTQVKPDEEYEVIEEGEHGKWLKIKVGEKDGLLGVEGWVSAEFVTKL